jgi:hypothetical protein
LYVLLPNATDAFVPHAKLFDYLLAPSHPEGGPKATFFALAGYTSSNAESLRTELLRIAREGNVTEQLQIEVGQKFVVEGALRTRNGRGIPLRTVWVIDHGTAAPRFVTAYPL